MVGGIIHFPLASHSAFESAGKGWQWRREAAASPTMLAISLREHLARLLVPFLSGTPLENSMKQFSFLRAHGDLSSRHHGTSHLECLLETIGG